MRPWPLLVLASLALLTSCSSKVSLYQYLNRANFSLTGGSFFTDASEVTVKQILLDNGTLLGREVILEGRLVDTGDFATHMVIKDKSGQLLVLLTDVDRILRKISEYESHKYLRVLGTVERGKLGLPYLGAIAIIGMNKPSAHGSYKTAKVIK